MSDGQQRRYTTNDVYERLGGLDAKMDIVLSLSKEDRERHRELVTRVDTLERKQVRYTSLAIGGAAVVGWMTARWNILRDMIV